MKRLLAWWTEERRAYLLLVLPGVLVYWAVMAFPTVFSLGLSMTNYNGGVIFGNPNIQFVGLRHYLRMFNDRYFWISLKNNGLIMAISVFGQIPLGFLFAYVIHRKLIKFGDFFQTIIYLPCVISTIVVGRLWQSFFSPYGPFTKFMQTFQPGWENELAYDPQKAILPVLFVILWMYTGQYMIIFLANMQRIDPAIIEAARIDGAKESGILWHITLPALSGVIITTAILAISGSLKSFDLIYAMTNGGPAGQTRVLSLYMYQSAFQGAPNYPLANAISTVMVVISIILIIMTMSLGKAFREKEV